MSNAARVKEAQRRREIFNNLSTHLGLLKDAVKKIDGEAKVYLFGSAARGEHILSSDIDILIVSELPPAQIIAWLRKAGFEEPFEFHVVCGERAERYLRTAGEIVEL